MALASQSTRPSMVRTPLTRRGRRRNRRVRVFVGLFMVAVVIVLGWQGLKWLSGGGDLPTGPSEARASVPGGEIANTPVNAGIDDETFAAEREEASRTVFTPEVLTQPFSEPAPLEPEPTPMPIVAETVPPNPREVIAEESAPALSDPVLATSPVSVRDMMARAADHAEVDKLLEARLLFNTALHDPQTNERDRDYLRRRLTEINQKLVFEPILMPGDPYMREYIIKPGDALSRIARRDGVHVEWQFIQRINRISNPSAIRGGQSIKVPSGVFHAVVHKPSYRMDLYMSGEDSNTPPMYVCSFPVGLGEYDSTPVGKWVVTPGKKMINPAWANPRTGEYFRRDDPRNPIGERWIALTGVDPNTQVRSGYGIHGTVDPESIGQSVSMGCVRLLPQHVEVVYEVLSEEASTVIISEL